MKYLNERKKQFLQIFLLLLSIVFSCFVNEAQARLSFEECFNKRIDLLATGFDTSGDPKNIKIVQYKVWSSTIALYQGECAHDPAADEAVKQAKEYLKEAINGCIASGQGSNCGVESVVSNSQQNNSQVSAKQITNTTENLNDDPKVFGGGSSPKIKKK